MAAVGGFNTDILSDETFDFLCTVCKNKGKNTEAVQYCTDCADYYCLTCVKVHEDIPLLKGHKILNQGNIKSGMRKQLPMVPTERCDRHGHKPVDMYCQNHDTVGCTACMAVEHRSCKDIFYIPEFIQNNTSFSSTPNIKKKLKSTEKSLQQSLQSLEQEIQNVLKRKAESIENIRKLRRDIDNRLDEMERKSVAVMEDKYKAVIQQIEDDIRILKENKADVTSARDTLGSAGKNVSQVFVGTKKGEAAASKANISTVEITTGNQKEEVNFTADTELSNIFKKLNSLGKITLKYNRLRTAKLVQHNDILLQTKGMKRCSVKIPFDKTDCSIISSCFLEDGTVILSDMNNECLTRLDKATYTVRDHYDLSWTPWKVCAINNQEVAVCSLQQSEILFITIGNTMTKQSLMEVEFICCGLAYTGDILYILDNNKTVYMYTLSRQKLKQFRINLPGMFDFIHGLAVSKDGSMIYAVFPNNGLIVLDKTGKVVKKFNDQLLETAYDCFVTDRGNVLVCGFRSNNVLQLTSVGELIGEVAMSNSCKTVCCNWHLSKMIVGKGRNEIEVHDLV